MGARRGCSKLSCKIVAEDTTDDRSCLVADGKNFFEPNARITAACTGPDGMDWIGEAVKQDTKKITV